ncbi:MAG: hypothetical protein GX424_11140 [Clostridiales bacterium]|jgi:hypothetical protein|nr:hypothetical protein [Clostridiales bacterium]
MAENLNNPEMQRLQQDAIRRAREMQARAQRAFSSNQPAQRPAPVQSRPPAAPSPGPQHRHIPPEPRAPEPREGGPEPRPGKEPLNPVGDIFESLLADSERTLILVLILILVEEKADTGVIFALMYLVL